MKSAGRRRANACTFVVEDVGNAALADVLGKALQLVARQVDVRGQRLVFEAKLVAGAEKHVRDAAKPVGGAILLFSTRDVTLCWIPPSKPFALVGSR